MNISGIMTVSQWVNHWVERLVAAMGMAMVLIVGAQVFSRYGLNHSLFWSEELARFLLVWLTFLGSSTAYFRGAHPGVDALFSRLGPKGQRISVWTVHLAALVLFGVMLVYGIQFAWFVRLQITPALGLPKWIPMAGVPLSSLVFILHCLGFMAGELGAGTEEGGAA